MRHLSCNSCAEKSTNESGAIILSTLIILVALLTVAGLAIDAGNLYQARIAMQNAADSTALATVNYITLRGKLQTELDAGAEGLDDNTKSANITAFLADRVQKLAKANMDAANLPELPDHPIIVSSQYLPASLSTNPAGSSYEFTVTISRKIDFLLMDRFPWINKKDELITVSAASQRETANVALLLDISGSMACPAAGPCDCLGPTRASVCPATGRRFDDLMDGVTSFLQLMDLENDHITIVPFNLIAFSLNVRNLRTNGSKPITFEEVERVADNIKHNFGPNNSTNICDALMEGYAALDAVASGKKTSYILFTDGAPTAGRFLFSADAVTGRLQSANRGFGEYDYSNYSVEWVRDQEKVQTGEPLHTAGPSLLVATDALIDPNDNSSPAIIVDVSKPPRGTSVCDDGLAQSPAVKSPADRSQVAQQVFSPCLKSLKAHMPNDPSTTYDAGYVSDPGAPFGFQYWQRAYYHCAIELADFIRGKKGVFYTIRLGDTALLSPDPADPYEDISDSFHRKDIFMSRLTLDPFEGAKHTIDNGGQTRIVDFPYAEYKTYSEAAAGDSRKFGVYLPTHDSSQLKLLFQDIAQRVLLKLTS
jgi:Flp pilus assembly protein TadG